MRDESVPVLIVGAGPVGLSTAVFLGRHGIRTLVVEKRGETSMLPRAPGLQARTMELFRAAGLGKEIRALEKRLVHWPMGRFGTLDEAAATIAFLASEDAGFITAAALPLDGGITQAFTVPE